MVSKALRKKNKKSKSSRSGKYRLGSPKKTQYVYFYGGGKAEGAAKMKQLLGGKGANLAEMTNLGIPVPPGFTIATNVCELYYKNNHSYPSSIQADIDANLSKLEKLLGKSFGD